MNKCTIPSTYRLLGALALAFGTAQAGILTSVTSRAAFGGNDSLNWSTIGASGTVLPTSFAITSTGGLGLTVSLAGGSGFQRMTQGYGWNGNFTASDPLLFNRNNGPITFVLDNPIIGAGFNIQADYWGTYTAKIEAFNGLTSLGFVTVNGVSSMAGDGSAAFIGFKSDLPDVTSFKVSLTAQAAGQTSSFAVNRVSLAVVPEPSEYAIVVGMALGSLALVRRVRQGQATLK